MVFDPNIHHRRTIRLRDYDYSQSSAYHVTICAQDDIHVFGHMKDDTVCLNPAGEMICKWIDKLPEKFDGLYRDEYMLMPNHLHLIVFLNTQFVGIDSCVDVGTNPCVCPENSNRKEENKHGSLSLPTVVQWLKTMTTNEYIKGVKESNWMPFNQKLWQRNYYEHIIRNEIELCRIREYVSNNPSRWFTRNET